VYGTQDPKLGREWIQLRGILEGHQRCFTKRSPRFYDELVEAAAQEDTASDNVDSKSTLIHQLLADHLAQEINAFSPTRAVGIQLDSQRAPAAVEGGNS